MQIAAQICNTMPLFRVNPSLSLELGCCVQTWPPLGARCFRLWHGVNFAGLSRIWVTCDQASLIFFVAVGRYA